MTETARQKAIIKVLRTEYAGVRSALKFADVYQLLVAVMLSAQTNDNQVNKATEKLFSLFGTPEAMAGLQPEELEQYIKTCGLYKNKAKNIVAASKMLLKEFGGEVPKTRGELMRLPGVGRKTANVVLSVGFGLPALAVDTHVLRVANRLGFSIATTPDEVEKDLCRIIPEKWWKDAHHWLIWHGRRVCKAQRPACEECILNSMCPKKKVSDK